MSVVETNMEKLDLNTASEKELLGVPGMSIDFVARVLAWRARGRRFNKLEDLRYIKGIGPVTFHRLAPYFVASEAPEQEVEGPPYVPADVDLSADEAVFLAEALYSSGVQEDRAWTEKEWRRAWLLSLEGPALVAGRLEDFPTHHLKPLLRCLRLYMQGTCSLGHVFPFMAEACVPAPSWDVVAALAYWTREMQRLVLL